MSSLKELQASVSSQIREREPQPTRDAIQERAKATFSVDNMASYVNGGKENIEKRQRFAAELEQQPWSSKERRHFLTREEDYVGALRVATELWARMSKGDLNADDALILRGMIDWPGGLELHIGMFIPTILGQGTEEQKRELLPKCNSLEIIGTYAQTELGHGTFVRGLETTATFDAASQSFLIHSPTQTATKWWPGGLGKTATHAVVMARLFLAAKDYGPHAFVVQLRDLRSHRSLPGVEIGDIGPKFGYNGVDNGFLRFDHVVVPRSAMLSRFAQVTPEGRYVPPPKDNQKAMYSTMLFVRADIVQHAARYLAKAACIATRYCCVRRQTAPSADEQELQVIDYENTAATLLPLIATSYVNLAMGRTLWAAYKDYERLRAEGRFDSLPELHALSSGLKALTTEATADGMEAARRTCGGHGFSLLSGLPSLFASYVQNCTWEGDNNVLLLQTARYVIKLAAAARDAVGGPRAEAGLPQSLQYLAQAGRARKRIGEAGWAQAFFAARARYVIDRAITDVTSHPAAGGRLKFEGPAWNSCTTSLIAVGRVHCHVALLRNFESSVAASEAKGDVGVREAAVLRRLGHLWAVSLTAANLGDFIVCGCVSTAEVDSLHRLQRDLLWSVRPDAISLVDAWAFTDYELNSALGKYDGDVYTALLDMAKRSPLNATDEGPAWESVLKPAINKLRSKL